MTHIQKKNVENWILGTPLTNLYGKINLRVIYYISISKVQRYFLLKLRRRVTKHDRLMPTLLKKSPYFNPNNSPGQDKALAKTASKSSNSLLAIFCVVLILDGYKFDAHMWSEIKLPSNIITMV